MVSVTSSAHTLVPRTHVFDICVQRNGCAGEIADWLQSVLWLVVLPSRPDGYDPLKIKNLTTSGVEKLAKASARAWDAVCAQDKKALGQSLLDTMDAWAEILPETVRTSTTIAADTGLVSPAAVPSHPPIARC